MFMIGKIRCGKCDDFYKFNSFVKSAKAFCDDCKDMLICDKCKKKFCDICEHAS
jgi:hypothetical protein